MKQTTFTKRLTAVLLSLVLLLALAACGGKPAQADPQKPGDADMVRDDVPSATLKGIFDALTAEGSDYSEYKTLYKEYYPELEYVETLEADRINLTFKANGNEYFTDGSWDFVEDGNYLTAVIDESDYTGVFRVMNVASAIGDYFGMDTDLVNGYLNGIVSIDPENENFRMTEDEAAGTLNFRLNIAGPWDMKELEEMVIDAELLDEEPLNSDYSSQSASVGKMRMLANGSVDDYTVLFAEYGGAGDLTYQSIVNVVQTRKPANWEAFLADFTALQDLETDDYKVILDPDDATIQDIFGELNDKYGYVLVQFGEPESYEYETSFVPSAEIFAEFYFRVVGGYHKGTAGASLEEASAACDVLCFAVGNELHLADIEELRANMLEGWESLSDEERADFDANFADLDALLKSCFEDWDSVRGRFEDAGVSETMDDVLSNEMAGECWEILSAHTWTLGNSND